MISLISFEESLVMKKELADKLGLKYKSAVGMGKIITYGASYENVVENDDYYFMDELYMHVEGDDVTYYLTDKMEKEIDNYYIYTKIPNEENKVYVEKDKHLVDLELFATQCPFDFKIIKSVQNMTPELTDIRSIMVSLENKLTSMNRMVDNVKNSSFNEKVNVHTGGGLLVTYNDLKLKEDCCTDLLQSELNDGWRIISVCVQNDQRRPDYILGRYNPELDVHSKDRASR